MAEKKPFDLRTHIRHPHSGRIISENHYRLVAEQSNQGSGVELAFERPPLSGLWYYADDTMCLERSKEGLARQAREDAEKSKTELQRAEEEHRRAEAKLRSAKQRYDDEERTKKLEALPKGK